MTGVQTCALPIYYVVNVDWNIKTPESHTKIWNMHTYLKDLGVRHVFFSGHSTFSDIQPQQNWENAYIYPYSREHSYNAVLRNNGFEYVNSQSFHVGADGHCFWAEYMLQYINDNQLLATNEIPTY